MNQQGTLIVRPICGRLTRDTDFFTKMDPYCVVALGSQKQKTRVAVSAGKTPNWQDQLVFKKTFEDSLKIEVWDYDSNSRDDLVGEGYVTVQRVTSTPNWEDWVEVVHKGRKAGDIKLSVTFTPDSSAVGYNHYGNAPQPAYPMYPPQMQGAYPAYPPSVVYVNYTPPPAFPGPLPAYGGYPPPPPPNYGGYQTMPAQQFSHPGPPPNAPYGQPPNPPYGQPPYGQPPNPAYGQYPPPPQQGYQTYQGFH